MAGIETQGVSRWLSMWPMPRFVWLHVGMHGSCVRSNNHAFVFLFTLGGRTSRASLHVRTGHIVQWNGAYCLPRFCYDRARRYVIQPPVLRNVLVKKLLSYQKDMMLLASDNAVRAISWWRTCCISGSCSSSSERGMGKALPLCHELDVRMHFL